MNRAAVATSTETADHVRPLSHERGGWRAFLVSWQLAAILVIACVLGLVAIFAAANPFASQTVSERVSAAIGTPATCAELGAASGEGSGIYRCTIDTGKQTVAKCYVIADGNVKQYASNRRGC